MYLVNEQVTAVWHLMTGTSPPSLGALDVTITDAEGDAIFISGAISAGNYTPSTEFTKGEVKYNFTPNQLGAWKILLSTGTSDELDGYFEYGIMVIQPDTFTKKRIPDGLL